MKRKECHPRRPRPQIFSLYWGGGCRLRRHLSYQGFLLAVNGMERERERERRDGTESFSFSL